MVDHGKIPMMMMMRRRRGKRGRNLVRLTIQYQQSVLDLPCHLIDWPVVVMTGGISGGGRWYITRR